MKLREKSKSKNSLGPQPASKNSLGLLKWLDPFTYVDAFLLPKINPKNKSWISWTVYLISALVFALLLYSVIGFVLKTPFPLVIVVSGSMEPVYFRGDLIILQGATADTLNAPVVELPQQSLQGSSVGEFAVTYCINKNSPDQEIPCSAFRSQFLSGQIKPSDVTTSKILIVDRNQEISVKTAGDVVVYFSDLQGNKPVIHRAVLKIKAKDGVFILTKGDSAFNPFIDQEAGISYSPIPVSELKGKSLFKIPLIGYLKLLLIDDVQTLLMGCHQAEGCLFP